MLNLKLNLKRLKLNLLSADKLVGQLTGLPFFISFRQDLFELPLSVDGKTGLVNERQSFKTTTFSRISCASLTFGDLSRLSEQSNQRNQTLS